MTVQSIRPPTRVPDLVSTARSCVREACAVPLSSLSVDELTDSLESLAALESQVTALKLATMAETDQRDVARSLGATGTDAWVARLTGSTRDVTAGGLWLADRLRTTYDATREAFADGVINQAQASVIVRAGEKLPAELSPDERRAAEAGLVVKAVNGMDAGRLRQAARRMLDVVSRDLADRHEADLLEAEERRAERETWMTLHDNGDGTFVGRFVIPELQGQMLRAALDRLTSPQRLSRNRAGDVVEDDSLPGDSPRLSWSERLGVGFTELVEHLPTEATGGFGRVGASVMVHIDLHHLLDGLASARLDAGARISAGQARRLACNAGIIPAVLGSRSEPLDVGYAARFHNAAMRRGLSISHDTCATDGCERPFAWCDVHHLHPWSLGGPTSLANGLPLCGFHHQRAHDGRFTLARLSSGEVRFRRRT